MDVNATLMSIKCVFNILVLHITAQKMKFSRKISSVNVTKSDLVTFTEEILNGKLHFLCGVWIA